MSDTLLSRMEQIHSRMSNFEDVSDETLLSDSEIDQISSYELNNIANFENNPEVVQDYDTLTSYLGENQDFLTKMMDSDQGPAEMMRDDFMRITSVAGKASALKDAPEEVKAAYRNLREKWESAEVTGTDEVLDAVKDYGMDVLANFETIPTVLSVMFGGIGGAGASASVRTGAKAGLSKALQKAAANPVKSTAAYTGAITGVQDLAMQDLEIEIGERKEGINLGQTAVAATTGAVIGGGLAYGMGKVASKYASKRLDKDLNEVPQLSDSKGIELYNEGIEGEWIPASGEAVVTATNRLLEGPEGSVLDLKDVNKAADDFVEEVGGGDVAKEEFKTIVTGALKSGATGEVIKSKIAFGIWKTATDLTGNVFGKSAGVLTPYTKFSKTAKTLQSRLSHEFAEGFGKTKERIGMDFSEAAAALTGGFNRKYNEIVEPLALNTIKGDISDEVNDALNKAIRGDMRGAPANIQKAATEIRGLFKNIGDQLYSEGIIANKIDNYIPRMWNRKAIESDQDSFDNLLLSSGEAKDLTEARRISDSMLDIENQLDGGTGGQFFASKRKFKFENDATFVNFLNTDLMDVTLDYNFQAGKALAKKKVLLATNEKEFINNWINPIVKEMKASGKTLDKKEREQIRELYRSATGENMGRYGSKMQTAADGYTLGTRLALLPLATIGSLTEVFINIGKSGVLNSVKGFKEASELSFKKATGDLHSELKNRHGLTAAEAFREMKSFGIAMEQAQAQIGNRLAGEDLASETMQNVSNKFFRMNFLDQWTKFVQTASFASGKNLIRENLDLIAAHGNQPPTAKIETLIGELNELNIDYKKGVEWVNGGAKNTDKFYDEMLGGAARYTNSVILQPSAMSGLKPLLHSNPKTSIAFQLLGYPAAFTNTVLKGAAKAVTKDTKRNAPRLALAGLLMTETARMTNYFRSDGKSERDVTPTEARLSAIKRWGGNGLLFDNLQRASDAAKYSGTVSGYATAPFGPIASDVLGLAYGKYHQVLGTKVPFFGAGSTIAGPENMRKYRDMLREKDKDLKGLIPEFEYDIQRQQFLKGGEVKVPNAPAEPDERINKYTGLPYNYEAGSAFMDELDPKKVERQGFAIGGAVAKKLSGYIAETINEATDGILDPKVINQAAKKIEDETGLTEANKVPAFNETYDPDYADFGGIDDFGIDEAGGLENLESYISTSIKAVLREKDQNIKPYSEETLAIQKSDKSETYGEDFQRSRGYTEEEIDNFDYQAELAETVDPTQSMFADIQKTLGDIRTETVSYISTLADPEKLEAVKQFDNVIDIFARNDKFVPATNVTTEGKKKIVANYIANNSDNPDLISSLKAMQKDAPQKMTGQDAVDLVPEDQRLKNLDDFLGSSKEQEPMFRGISDFGEKDFEVAFVSPREMGVHVGTRGQAQYIMAKSLNDNRAMNELAIPSTGQNKVTNKEMDEFFSDEVVRRQETTMEDVDFENMTQEDLDYMGSMDLAPSSRMPPVSMTKGFINVKNPLEFDTDASNWTAENLLTTSYDQLYDAIRNGLGKKIPKKFEDRLNALAGEALEVPKIPDIFDSSKQILDTSFRHVALTKKLQGLLEDMGFDSIKYRNMVEPSLVGEKSNSSYILFRPEQYKNVNASKFDQQDKRMMFNEGGLLYNVKRGETLTKIAAENNTDVQTLVALNKIKDADKISVDQEIMLPKKKVANIDRMLWATKYNAEDKPLEELLSKYDAAQNIEVTDTVKNVAKYAANSGAFSNELMDMGLTPAELEQGLIDYSKIESSGGHLSKSKQVSSGKAQGLFQVIYPSAKSVLKQGQFGPKSAAAAGYTLDELNSMSKEELRSKLLNDDKLNALFASAIIVQKLQTLKNKKEPRVKKNLGSLVSKAIAPKMTEGFYSALEKAALNLKRKEGTGQGFINDLKKGEKVTSDELEFTGVADKLKDVKKISKEEVQELVSNSKIELNTIKGQVDGEFETEYDQYTLSGKPKNYKEILINIPENTNNEKLNSVKFENTHWNNAARQADKDPEKVIAHLRVSDVFSGKDPNKKALLIEEVQSDYHQAGSKSGYESSKSGYEGNAVSYTEEQAEEISGAYRDLAYSKFTKRFAKDYDDAEDLMEEADDFAEDTREVIEELLTLGLTKEKTGGFAERFSNYKIKNLELEEELASYTNIYNPNYVDDPDKANAVYLKMKELEKDFIEELKDSDPSVESAYKKYLNDDVEEDTPVPEAPFKKTWHKLSINKALIEAAEQGKDAIALTTGEQQARRYSSSGLGDQEGLGEKYDGAYLKHLKAFGKKYNEEVSIENVSLSGVGSREEPVYFLNLTQEMKDDILKGLPQFAEGGLVEE